MKITFCHNETEYLCDAQSIFLQRLMPELKELGHEPRLVLISPRDPERCALPKVCRKYDISYDATYSRGSMGNNIRWCLQKLRDDPPDVFVPHHCYWALYAARWLKSSGIPSIGVLHSDDEPTKQIIRLFGHKNSPFGLDAFVAVSQDIAGDVVEVNSDLPVRVIPCGVPLPHVLVSAPVGELRVAYLGRIVQEQKRIVDVARAFCEVTQEVPGVECHIWGSGEDENLVRQVLDVEDSGQKVVRHPAIPITEVYQRLSEHHVIVLLSDYEGTPTSLMEGMANGLVPVVTDIGGGVAALVKNNTTGLVVYDREEGFCKAISKLAREQETWERLSRNAAKHIAMNFSTKVTAIKWADFATELLKSYLSRTSIQVPKNVDIAKEWQVPGPNYYSRHLDCLAETFAVGRYLLNRFK